MIACDLGSNTFRVVKIDCQSKKRVAEFEKIVKTADGLQNSGEISKLSINRIIEAIKEAKKAIDFSNDEVYAVATAAFRIASNSKKALTRIKKETGLEVEVISGTHEANLTAIAVSEALKRLDLEYQDFILLDLGGGSSELFIQKKDRAFIKSFDIGIVTLTQKYNSFDEMQESINLETKDIEKFISEIYSSFSKPKVFISTAGTATTLASLNKGIDYEHYEHEIINGTILNIEDIDKLFKRLLEFDEKERNRWVGVGRSDLIFSGIAILKSVLKIAGFENMIVIDDGLREGLAISKCK